MNAGAATTRRRPDAGVTLIEILIVTVIIALMAALAFPVYKIVQQREKERRLKKILNDVRLAISGGKSQLSTALFSEGMRTFVRIHGTEKIKKAHELPPSGNSTYDPTVNDAVASAAISSFTQRIVEDGKGYPPTPFHLTYQGYTFVVATGSSHPDSLAGNVTLDISRRFLRNLPPHPFQSWYPNATWTFRPAYYNPKIPANAVPVSSHTWGVQQKNFDDATGPVAERVSRYGVMDIYSSGAGIALDGSNTDEW